MTDPMKARAVYRALETARRNGVVGLNKKQLQKWCASAHSMTPAQVEKGIEALVEGEMLNYDKTVVMDWINGHVYRIVDVSVLAERMAFQRDIDRRTRYTITQVRRTRVKASSLMDDAFAQGDIKRAVELGKVLQRADDVITEVKDLQRLVGAL